MKKSIMELIVVFLIFFVGMGSVLYVDEICFETTGEGGNLVLDIDNLRIFH